MIVKDSKLDETKPQPISRKDEITVPATESTQITESDVEKSVEQVSEIKPQQAAESKVLSVKNQKKKAKRSPKKKESQIPVSTSRKNSKDSSVEQTTEISKASPSEPKIEKVKKVTEIKEEIKDEIKTNQIDTSPITQESEKETKSAKKHKKSRIPKPTQPHKLEIKPRDSIELAKSKAKNENKIKITVTESDSKQSSLSSSKDNIVASQLNGQDNIKQHDSDKKESANDTKSQKVELSNEQSQNIATEFKNELQLNSNDDPQSRSSIVKSFFKNIKLTKDKEMTSDKDLLSLENTVESNLENQQSESNAKILPTEENKIESPKELDKEITKKSKSINFNRFKVRKLFTFNKNLEASREQKQDAKQTSSENLNDENSEITKEEVKQPEIEKPIDESETEIVQKVDESKIEIAKTKKLFGIDLRPKINLPKLFAKKPTSDDELEYEKTTKEELISETQKEKIDEKAEEKAEEKTEEKAEEKAEEKTEVKAEEETPDETKTQKIASKKLFRIKLKPISPNMFKLFSKKPSLIDEKSESVESQPPSSEIENIETEELPDSIKDEEKKNEEKAKDEVEQPIDEIKTEKLTRSKKVFVDKLEAIKPKFSMPKLKLLGKKSSPSDNNLSNVETLTTDKQIPKIQTEIVETDKADDNSKKDRSIKDEPTSTKKPFKINLKPFKPNLKLFKLFSKKSSSSSDSETDLKKIDESQLNKEGIKKEIVEIIQKAKEYVEETKQVKEQIETIAEESDDIMSRIKQIEKEETEILRRHSQLLEEQQLATANIGDIKGEEITDKNIQSNKQVDDSEIVQKVEKDQTSEKVECIESLRDIENLQKTEKKDTTVEEKVENKDENAEPKDEKNENVEMSEDSQSKQEKISELETIQSKQENIEKDQNVENVQISEGQDEKIEESSKLATTPIKKKPLFKNFKLNLKDRFKNVSKSKKDDKPSQTIESSTTESTDKSSDIEIIPQTSEQTKESKKSKFSNIFKFKNFKKSTKETKEQSLPSTSEDQDVTVILDNKPSDLRKSKLSDIFKSHKKLSIISEINVDTQALNAKLASSTDEQNIQIDENQSPKTESKKESNVSKSKKPSFFSNLKLSLPKKSTKDESSKQHDALKDDTSKEESKDVKEEMKDEKETKDEIKEETTKKSKEELLNSTELKEEKQLKSVNFTPKKSKFMRLFKIKKVSNRHHFPPIINEPSKLVEDLLNKDNEPKPLYDISIKIDNIDKLKDRSKIDESKTESLNQNLPTEEQKSQEDSQVKQIQSDVPETESKMFGLFKMKKSPKCDDFKKLTDELDQSSSTNELNKASIIEDSNLRPSSEKIDSRNDTGLSKKIFKLSTIFNISSRKSSKSSTSQLSNNDDLSKSTDQLSKDLERSSKETLDKKDSRDSDNLDQSTHSDLKIKKFYLPKVFKFKRSKKDFKDSSENAEKSNKEPKDEIKASDEQLVEPSEKDTQMNDSQIPSNVEERKLFDLSNIFKLKNLIKSNETENEVTAKEELKDNAEEVKKEDLESKEEDKDLSILDNIQITNEVQHASITEDNESDAETARKLFDLSNVFKFKISVKSSEPTASLDNETSLKQEENKSKDDSKEEIKEEIKEEETLPLTSEGKELATETSEDKIEEKSKQKDIKKFNLPKVFKFKKSAKTSEPIAEEKAKDSVVQHEDTKMIESKSNEGEIVSTSKVKLDETCSEATEIKETPIAKIGKISFSNIFKFKKSKRLAESVLKDSNEEVISIKPDDQVKDESTFGEKLDETRISPNESVEDKKKSNSLIIEKKFNLPKIFKFKKSEKPSESVVDEKLKDESTSKTTAESPQSDEIKEKLNEESPKEASQAASEDKPSSEIKKQFNLIDLFKFKKTEKLSEQESKHSGEDIKPEATDSTIPDEQLKDKSTSQEKLDETQPPTKEQAASEDKPSSRIKKPFSLFELFKLKKSERASESVLKDSNEETISVKPDEQIKDESTSGEKLDETKTSTSESVEGNKKSKSLIIGETFNLPKIFKFKKSSAVSKDQTSIDEQPIEGIEKDENLPLSNDQADKDISNEDLKTITDIKRDIEPKTKEINRRFVPSKLFPENMFKFKKAREVSKSIKDKLIESTTQPKEQDKKENKELLAEDEQIATEIQTESKGIKTNPKAKKEFNFSNIFRLKMFAKGGSENKDLSPLEEAKDEGIIKEKQLENQSKEEPEVESEVKPSSTTSKKFKFSNVFKFKKSSQDSVNKTNEPQDIQKEEKLDDKRLDESKDKNLKDSNDEKLNSTKDEDESISSEILEKQAFEIIKSKENKPSEQLNQVEKEELPFDKNEFSDKPEILTKVDLLEEQTKQDLPSINVELVKEDKKDLAESSEKLEKLDETPSTNDDINLQKSITEQVKSDEKPTCDNQIKPDENLEINDQVQSGQTRENIKLSVETESKKEDSDAKVSKKQKILNIFKFKKSSKIHEKLNEEKQTLESTESPTNEEKSKSLDLPTTDDDQTIIASKIEQKTENTKSTRFNIPNIFRSKKSAKAESENENLLKSEKPKDESKGEIEAEKETKDESLTKSNEQTDKQAGEELRTESETKSSRKANKKFNFSNIFNFKKVDTRNESIAISEIPSDDNQLRDKSPNEKNETSDKDDSKQKSSVSENVQPDSSKANKKFNLPKLFNFKKLIKKSESAEESLSVEKSNNEVNKKETELLTSTDQVVDESSLNDQINADLKTEEVSSTQTFSLSNIFKFKKSAKTSEPIADEKDTVAQSDDTKMIEKPDEDEGEIVLTSKEKLDEKCSEATEIKEPPIAEIGKFSLSKIFKFKKSEKPSESVVDEKLTNESTSRTTAKSPQSDENKEKLNEESPKEAGQTDSEDKPSSQIKQQFSLSKIFKFKKSERTSESALKDSNEETISVKPDEQIKDKSTSQEKLDETQPPTKEQAASEDKPSSRIKKPFSLFELFKLKKSERASESVLKDSNEETISVKPDEQIKDESTSGEKLDETRTSPNESVEDNKKSKSLIIEKKFNLPKIFKFKKSEKPSESVVDEKSTDESKTTAESPQSDEIKEKLNEESPKEASQAASEDKPSSEIKKQFNLIDLFKFKKTEKLSEQESKHSGEDIKPEATDSTIPDEQLKDKSTSQEKLDETQPPTNEQSVGHKVDPKASKKKLSEMYKFKKQAKDNLSSTPVDSPKSTEASEKPSEELKTDITKEETVEKSTTEVKKSSLKNLSKKLTLPVSKLVNRKPTSSKECTPVVEETTTLITDEEKTPTNLESKSPEAEKKSESKKVEKKLTIVESEKPSKVLSPGSEQRGIWTAIKDTFSSHKQSSRHEGDSSMEPTVDETGYESQVDADLEVEEFSTADVTVTQDSKPDGKEESEDNATKETPTQNNQVASEDESKHDSGKDESLLEDSSISEAKNDKTTKSRKEVRKIRKQSKHQSANGGELTSPEDEGSSDMIIGAKGSKAKTDRRKRQKKKRQQTEQITKELKEPLKKVDEELDSQQVKESKTSASEKDDEIKLIEQVDLGKNEKEVKGDQKVSDDKKLIEQEELELAIEQSKELEAIETDKQEIKLIPRRKHRKWLRMNRVLNRTHSNVSSNLMQGFLRFTMPNLDVLSSI